MSFIFLREISVRGYQAMHATYVASPIPVFSIRMFSHALVSRLGCGGGDCIIVSHDARMELESMPKFNKKTHAIELQTNSIRRRVNSLAMDESFAKSPKSDIKPQSIPFQPAMFCCGCFSIIIRVDGAVNKDDISYHIGAMRFAGGIIDDVASISVLEKLPSSIPPGYVVADESPLVKSRIDSGVGVIEAVRTIPADRKGDHFILSGLGFSTITEFKIRKGSRKGPDNEDIPAAYCEPLIGLVRMTNKRKVSDLGSTIWRYETFQLTPNNQTVEFFITKN